MRIGAKVRFVPLSVGAFQRSRTGDQEHDRYDRTQSRRCAFGLCRDATFLLACVDPPCSDHSCTLNLWGWPWQFLLEELRQCSQGRCDCILFLCPVFALPEEPPGVQEHDRYDRVQCRHCAAVRRSADFCFFCCFTLFSYMLAVRISADILLMFAAFLYASAALFC